MRVELLRTGDIPLVFNGNRRHEATTEPMRKFLQAYTLRLYAVDGGGWATHVIFTSAHPREREVSWAIGPLRTAWQMGAALVAFAREHDPRDVLLGFPSAEQFQPKLAKVASRLSMQLKLLVQEAMHHLIDP